MRSRSPVGDGGVITGGGGRSHRRWLTPALVVRRSKPYRCISTTRTPTRFDVLRTLTFSSAASRCPVRRPSPSSSSRCGRGRTRRPTWPTAGRRSRVCTRRIEPAACGLNHGALRSRATRRRAVEISTWPAAKWPAWPRALEAGAHQFAGTAGTRPDARSARALLHPHERALHDHGDGRGDAVALTRVPRSTSLLGRAPAAWAVQPVLCASRPIRASRRPGRLRSTVRRVARPANHPGPRIAESRFVVPCSAVRSGICTSSMPLRDFTPRARVCGCSGYTGNRALSGFAVDLALQDAIRRLFSATLELACR